jgi:hypothetical protein
MENQANDQQDEELEEATKWLEPQDGSAEEEKFEDIGEIKPEEPQVLQVDLKPRLIQSSWATNWVPKKMRSCWIYWKNIGR